MNPANFTPATVAETCDEALWVITTYFNSHNYRSRRQNYDRFIESLQRIGVPILTMECAFGDAPFALPPSVAVKKLRSPSILWQKERLLNIALQELPPTAKKVAWIDADLLFENPRWHVEALQLLENHSVVQLFDSVVCLPRGHDSYNGVGDTSRGFCAQIATSPNSVQKGWGAHGHTGYAWAARREVLEAFGLFDLFLSGGADHLMAHGLLGDIDSNCVRDMIGLNTALYRKYEQWAKIAFSACQGNLGHVPGRIFHLWHGDFKDRKYHLRCQELKALKFDPDTDLALSHNGSWTWTARNPRLASWSQRLFASRREDGNGNQSPAAN